MSVKDIKTFIDEHINKDELNSIEKFMVQSIEILANEMEKITKQNSNSRNVKSSLTQVKKEVVKTSSTNTPRNNANTSQTPRNNANTSQTPRNNKKTSRNSITTNDRGRSSTLALFHSPRLYAESHFQPMEKPYFERLKEECAKIDFSKCNKNVLCEKLDSLIYHVDEDIISLHSDFETATHYLAAMNACSDGIYDEEPNKKSAIKYGRWDYIYKELWKVRRFIDKTFSPYLEKELIRKHFINNMSDEDTASSGWWHD